MRVWYITLLVLVVVQLVFLAVLLFWVYINTKKWGLAYAAASLEWPIRNMELKNQISHGQLMLLKITAYLRSAILVFAAFTGLIILIALIWRH